MKFTCILFTLFIGSLNAFSIEKSTGDAFRTIDRRSLITGTAGLFGLSILGNTEDASAIIYPSAAGGYKLGDLNSVVGREIRSFNGLIYYFRNTALDGGLDASTLKEPSVPFLEFGEKMKNGEVAFVEFIAPYGEVAYVTFKPNEGKPAPKPIRIGQGYPTMSKDSWSSPDYVIRSVSNFGVPYKFTVPALKKFSTTA